jgi:AcrR family transcriptional regulator
LLDAALRSFATRGVDGTVITDLEEAAGLAPGSGGFYRYFKTKDEVLTAVVRREIDRIVDAAPAPTDASGADPRAVTEAGIRAGFTTLRSLGPLIAILAREAGRIPELAAEVADRLVERPLDQPGADTDSDADIEERSTDALASPDRLRRVVVLTSMVGYELSRRYFGRPPGGVEEDDLVGALADLLLDIKEPSL